jgi:hypothetical protein
MIAVGANGIILTSTDGINWTNQKSNSSYDLYTVTSGNGIFLAGGGEIDDSNLDIKDNGILLQSSDGVNWENNSLFENKIIFESVFGKNLFILYTYNNITRELFSSTDGDSWDLIDLGNNWDSTDSGNNWYLTDSEYNCYDSFVKDSLYANNIFLITLDICILQSINGIDWTIIDYYSLFNILGEYGSISSVIFGNNFFVIQARRFDGYYKPSNISVKRRSPATRYSYIILKSRDGINLGTGSVIPKYFSTMVYGKDVYLGFSEDSVYRTKNLIDWEKL